MARPLPAGRGEQRQRRRRAHAAARLFHHALSAAAVGAMRPDPALFHAALGRAGVEPADALHVGDDP